MIAIELPSPQQQLLLKAALLRGKASLTAWAEWKVNTPIEQMDISSGWLLPQLYCNLTSQGIMEPSLDRYGVVYRQNWYKNHLFLHTINEALLPLSEAGCQVILLKGAAMAVKYYEPIGARPINHFDLWVPEQYFSRAVERLQSLGWVMRQQTEILTCLQDKFGRVVNLYMQIFDKERDSLIRKKSIWLAANQISALIFDPTDLLVYLCATVQTWDARSALFWVADAFTIMSSHPRINLSTLSERLAALNQQQSLIEALYHVIELFEART